MLHYFIVLNTMKSHLLECVVMQLEHLEEVKKLCAELGDLINLEKSVAFKFTCDYNS